MKKIATFLFITLLARSLFASDYGIYEKVIENAAGTPGQVANSIAEALQSSNLSFLNKLEVNTPNLVREDESKHSDFKAFLELATSTSFDSLLVKFGNRYAANWILRIGVYQDENGTQAQIANPETMTRIICNDLPDKDYQTVTAAAQDVKKDLRHIILSSVRGKKVAVQMPPIRDEDRLRQAKKDMPMMVGPMTFFKSDKQFPILKEVPAEDDAKATFNKVLAEIEHNLRQFQPPEKNADYHWCTNPESNLVWQNVCTAKLMGYNAAVIGITRGRTEALSFHICGMKREHDENSTPGIDHIAAHPIEVVIFEEDGKIKVGTAREMFRMDMFFWDAGKMAFMKYMNMPGMLDDSIKKAVIGTE